MISPAEQQNMNMLARARQTAQKAKHQIIGMRRRGQLRVRYQQQIRRLQAKLKHLKRNRVLVVRPGLDSLIGISLIIAIMKDLIDIGTMGASTVVSGLLGWIPIVGQILTLAVGGVGLVITISFGVIAIIVIGFCISTMIIMDPAMKGKDSTSKISIVFIFFGFSIGELLGFGLNMMPGMTTMVALLYWRIIVIRRRKRKKGQEKINGVKDRIKELKQKLRRFSLRASVR